MPQVVIPNRIISILLFIDGLAAVLLAAFANVTGLDPSPGWGLSRFLLLGFGFILLTVSLYWAKSKEVRFISSEGVKTVFMFAHIWVVIFLVYAWFITYGNFTSWQKSTRYYAHLADAFSMGQLYVDIKPNAELVKARDPYDSKDRPHFDDEIWDMSLYKGKLYIYWGPVPALFLLPFQARSSKLLFDIFLVYGFFCGLFVINSFFVLKLWTRLFSDVPLQNFLASLLLVAFTLPILWSLNVPDVYEAAIGAGQFFLIGGIYFSFLAMDANRKRYLLLAGLFGACSVGSRAVNVFSVVYMFVVLVVWIYKHQSGSLLNWKKSLTPILFLTVPLAVGAVLIGWYNWARFDSPFEFGLRYQITIYNLNRDANLAFQPDYFPFNFYAYLFQPFELVPSFPFIRPVHFSNLLSSLKIVQPKLYAAGPMVGVLFSTPFLFLSFIPLLSKNKSAIKPLSTEIQQLRKFLFLLLGGSLLINAAVILFYFYGQMRFLVDFASQVAILAVLGYWKVLQDHREFPTKRTQIYIHLANVLLILTLVFSVLLSFTSEKQRMEKFNSALIDKINSIFVIQPK